MGKEIEARIAVAPTAEGILIANNIFHFEGRSRAVAGDQSQKDQLTSEPNARVVGSSSNGFEDGRTELFDLEADPGEARDVSGRQPAEVSELTRQLRAWRESVGARMPTPNPNYRPQP